MGEGGVSSVWLSEGNTSDKVRRTCLAKALAACNQAYFRRCFTNHLWGVPHFDYCSVVWHHCGAIQTDRLERVQNYALCIILKKPPRTGSEPLRKTLGVPTLERRWQIQTL